MAAFLQTAVEGPGSLVNLAVAHFLINHLESWHFFITIIVGQGLGCVSSCVEGVSSTLLGDAHVKADEYNLFYYIYDRAVNSVINAWRWERKQVFLQFPWEENIAKQDSFYSRIPLLLCTQGLAHGCQWGQGCKRGCNHCMAKQCTSGKQFLCDHQNVTEGNKNKGC